MNKKTSLITVIVLILMVFVFWQFQKKYCEFGGAWDLCDTRGELRDRYMLQVEQALRPDNNGEVYVTGTVTNRGGADSPCERGDPECNFLLIVGDVTVTVYPNYSPNQPCINDEATQAFKRIYNADQVTLYGRYYPSVGITTCESDNYYLRKTP